MNTRLLNQVANAILDEPTKFNMQDWVMADDQSPCGTSACIAGHVVIQSRGYRKVSSLLKNEQTDAVYIPDDARTALGLNYVESLPLFHVGNWPRGFKGPYRNAKTPEERADAAFWRIQYFIASNGR